MTPAKLADGVTSTVHPGEVERCRRWLVAAVGRNIPIARAMHETMVALADQLEAARSTNARLVALLEDTKQFFAEYGCNFLDEELPACTETPPCWEHRRRALLAEIKAGG